MSVSAEYRKPYITGKRSSPRALFLIAILFAGFLLLLVGLMASVSVGAAEIRISTVVEAFVSYDQSKEHQIVRGLRLPRALAGALIGASLAVAGAIMQGMTRNPLASPQVFGINAGASLIVAGGVVLFPGLAPTVLVYLAFLGAAAGGLIVYSMSSSGGGLTPVKLALAGMTVHFFLTSITEGIIIFHEHSTESVLFWLAGAIDGRDWTHVRIVLPWAAGGFVVSMLLARPLTILNLGEDVSKGLGQKNEWIYLLSGIVVIVLAGSSVAVAGPIGFIGLIVPHIVRSLVGVDYRLVLPFSALFGALLLVYADVVSRFIAYPFESPVGIVTAMIGAPFFLYLARKGGQKLK